MYSASSLSRLFGTLIPLALSAAACGGTVDDPEAGTGGSSGQTGGSSGAGSSSGSLPVLDETLCDDGTYHPLEDLALSNGVEYIELRGITGGEQAHVIASWGEKCKGAGDRAACEEEVAKATVENGFLALGDRPESGAAMNRGAAPRVDEYLVTTKGDEVKTIATESELTELVSPMQSAKAAALQLYARGHYIVCPPGDPHSTARRNQDSSYSVITFAGSTCGAGTSYDQLLVNVSAAGTVSIEERVVLKEGDPGCAVGRLPNGLCSRAQRGAELASFFAEVAHLEAASVIAFEQIEAELRALGAPAALVTAAHKAQADEVRHAAAMAKQAVRFGGTTEAPVIEAQPLRARFEFARDNAIEGCVRETYGAMVAALQAERASDPAIAREMRIIAEEEAEHAALSWQIAAWIEPTLRAEERAAIELAKREMVAALRLGLDHRYAEEVRSVAGMPSPTEAQALLEQLAPHLQRAA